MQITAHKRRYTSVTTNMWYRTITEKYIQGKSIGNSTSFSWRRLIFEWRVAGANMARTSLAITQVTLVCKEKKELETQATAGKGNDKQAQVRIFLSYAFSEWGLGLAQATPESKWLAVVIVGAVMLGPFSLRRRLIQGISVSTAGRRTSEKFQGL